jgi:hypothetical protein
VGDSDADRRRQLATRGVNCLTEHTMQLVGNGQCGLFVRSRKGHDELVAADATRHAIAGDAALDSIADDPPKSPPQSQVSLIARSGRDQEPRPWSSPPINDSWPNI